MPQMTRGTRCYLNYYDSVRSIVSDAIYQTRLQQIDIDVSIQDFFAGSMYKCRKVLKEHTSSKDVYRVEQSDANCKTIYFNVHKIKNSGQDTSRKRVQIHANYFGFLGNDIRKENENYFFLGLYPHKSNGECIYVLLDNDGVSLNPKESYSSLWIDFEAIIAASQNGIYFAVNKRNYNKYVCFTKEYFALIIDAIMSDDYSNIIKSKTDIHFVDDNGKITEQREIYVDDYLPARDAVVTNEGKAKMKKNTALREVSFADADYTCALCGKQYTFVTNNDKMYFEAHHLIPCNINVQKGFKKKLDHTINLYCLCPECHRKIHLIRNSEIDGLLTELYSTREKYYKDIYNLGISQLVDIYKKIDRRDEDSM